MSNKVLIIGASGMLGGSLLRYLSKLNDIEVVGTVRSETAAKALLDQGFTNVFTGVNVTNFDSVTAIVKQFRPDYVLNCVGVIKQLGQSKDPVCSIEINSLLPHLIARLCSDNDARLIHFSTDCVFTGTKGGYVESDIPDATDLYGRSKLLGEVDYGLHLTLRTSIIGHELGKSVSLIDWFLGQKREVNGFRQAIFSGLPTVFLAEFLNDFVFGHQISGLYHLSVDSIDKYTLLLLVKKFYNADIKILPSDDYSIDRSLNSKKIRTLSGFKPPAWPVLIKKMHHEYCEYFHK